MAESEPETVADDSAEEQALEVSLRTEPPPARTVVLRAGVRILQIDAPDDLSLMVAAAERLWPLTNDPKALNAHGEREQMGFSSLASLETTVVADLDDPEDRDKLAP